MGLKENQFYDRDLTSYPVVHRQKKNISNKKSSELDLKIR
jgi:ribosomal 30S subunit maturation factor RimM